MNLEINPQVQCSLTGAPMFHLRSGRGAVLGPAGPGGRLRSVAVRRRWWALSPRRCRCQPRGWGCGWRRWWRKRDSFRRRRICSLAVEGPRSGGEESPLLYAHVSTQAPYVCTLPLSANELQRRIGKTTVTWTPKTSTPHFHCLDRRESHVAQVVFCRLAAQIRCLSNTC